MIVVLISVLILVDCSWQQHFSPNEKQALMLWHSLFSHHDDFGSVATNDESKALFIQKIVKLVQLGDAALNALPKMNAQSQSSPQDFVAAREDDNKNGFRVLKAPHYIHKPEERPELTYHSQCGQDFYIETLGFFVDLAANHAIDISNTYYLERTGWHGICIEANPIYFYGLLTERSCQLFGGVVANARNQKVKFRFKSYDSGIVGEEFDNKGEPKEEEKYDMPDQFLPTVTLRDILLEARAPKVIDYLSLDVEGAEYVVMKDFTFDDYIFQVITIERPPSELRDLLIQNKYVFIQKTAVFDDELWVHQSLLDRKFNGHLKPLPFDERWKQACWPWGFPEDVKVQAQQPPMPLDNPQVSIETPLPNQDDDSSSSTFRWSHAFNLVLLLACIAGIVKFVK